MVDDSHAAGFIGKTGRGSAEHHHCMDRVDIFTGTLGKALGGAMGGYTTGKKEIYRHVASTFQTLSILQLFISGNLRCLYRRIRHAEQEHRVKRQSDG